MTKITKEAFEAAHTKLAQEIYLPAFFDVLRHRGIVPQNEKEASDLLVLGEAARAAREAVAVKPVSRFSKLAASVSVKAQAPDQEAVLARAADEFAKQADLVTAALTVTQYTAKELASTVAKKGA